jgi:hypothetical protein
MMHEINYDALNAFIGLAALIIALAIARPEFRKLLSIADMTDLLIMSSMLIISCGFVIGNLPIMVGLLRAIVTNSPLTSQSYYPIFADVDFAQTGRALTVIGGLIGFLPSIKSAIRKRRHSSWTWAIVCLIFILVNGWYLIAGGFKH